MVTMNDVKKPAARLNKPIPFGRLQAVGGLLCLLLAYWVSVIILRYAFDIEFWNPF